MQRQRYAEVKLHGHATDPKARRGVEDPKTRAEERLMQLALKGERKKRKKREKKREFGNPKTRAEQRLMQLALKGEGEREQKRKKRK